jgi:hypothetical protein
MTMRIALLIFAFTFLGAAHGAGPRVSEADAKAIRTVVQGQLDAFASDDGAKAFSYAAPGIHAQFGIPEVFMAMVHEGYAVMLHPAVVQFLPPMVEAGQTIQLVRLTDDTGGVWLVRYVMEKQKSGAWRVGGCSLAQTAGTAA